MHDHRFSIGSLWSYDLALIIWFFMRLRMATLLLLPIYMCSYDLGTGDLQIHTHIYRVPIDIYVTLVAWTWQNTCPNYKRNQLKR